MKWRRVKVEGPSAMPRFGHGAAAALDKMMVAVLGGYAAGGDVENWRKRKPVVLVGMSFGVRRRSSIPNHQLYTVLSR